MNESFSALFRSLRSFTTIRVTVVQISLLLHVFRSLRSLTVIRGTVVQVTFYNLHTIPSLFF